MSRLLFGVLILFAASVPASAQDDARYRLEKSGDRFVRMDTRTGAMSICEDRGGELACRAASDGELEPGASAGRIAELEARVAALEARSGQPAAVPSDEEFERTLGFMERFFRRFIGIARELEQEETPPAPGVQPQRS